MLIGLFKAIRRILISAGLNVFYLSRLDIPLAVKGWEWLDKGIINIIMVKFCYNYVIHNVAYVSYTAILKMDATYNNPVMNVFVYLMTQLAEAKSTRNELYTSCKHIHIL